MLQIGSTLGLALNDDAKSSGCLLQNLGHARHPSIAVNMLHLRNVSVDNRRFSFFRLRLILRGSDLGILFGQFRTPV